MMRNHQKSPLLVECTPFSAEEGQSVICGALPSCHWRAAKAYYRRLESLLRRQCAALPQPARITVQTTLYRPEETLCSIRVQAELDTDGRRLPFLDDGCVWNLESGAFCALESLLGRRYSRRRLLRELEPRREPEWMLRSFPDWELRLRKAFSPLPFCLEEGGVRFLLPPLTLGPFLDSSCFLRLSGK